ncbi:hypothetical protein ACFXPW_15470 [Streptomyces goshikiensis]|uniref:hypothetical protein n=1 Tax=Streptomyces goshikiensis TaxID=1942 RepID=UPI0036AD3075
MLDTRFAAACPCPSSATSRAPGAGHRYAEGTTGADWLLDVLAEQPPAGHDAPYPNTAGPCSAYSAHWVPRLRAAFPEARFVQLFRDGADRALAMSRHPGYR